MQTLTNKVKHLKTETERTVDMRTMRGELFFLLNEVFINECPPVVIKLSFSLRVCEVEQNNVPPVLVSDSHPQTTGFGTGGAFLLHDDKSSRAQQFMLIVANLCRVTIYGVILLPNVESAFW